MRVPIITILLSSIILFASSLVFNGQNLIDTDPKEALQQILNGLYEQANLSDPTTVLDCFTGISAEQTVDFLSNLTSTLANEKYLKVPGIVFDYKKNVDPQVGVCVQNNQEVLECMTAYGTANITLTTLISKVEKYTISHYSDMDAEFKKWNQELEDQEYKTYGSDAGVLLQAIMANGH